MANKIDFIREYESRYGIGTIYDVVYKTKRVCTYHSSELPKTAERFINEAKTHREQPVTEYRRDENGKLNKVQIGTEIIHTNEE